MRTLVFQSFRTTDVPNWMQRCMTSVEQWSGLQGYSYKRLGDEFFDVVPGWFRERSTQSHLPSTDLARLLWISAFLKDEWERVIWFDADVLIFNPEAMRIECRAPEMMCYEVWLREKPNEPLQPGIGVNNCTMSFTRESSFLEFYIQSCLRIAKQDPDGPSRNRLGPGLLKWVHRGTMLELIRTVAMFSPYMIRQIADGKKEAIRLYAEHWQGEIHAANLCSSVNDVNRFAQWYRVRAVEKAVKILLETKGSVVNPR